MIKEVSESKINYKNGETSVLKLVNLQWLDLKKTGQLHR